MTEEQIGIGYRIDLVKLAESIRQAKGQLSKFHKDLSSLAKNASVKITVVDRSMAQAQAKVKRFASAIKAELDASGRLNLKEVPDVFPKISGGNIDRVKKDYETLFNKYKDSPALLEKMNKSFVRVNDAIGQQALRMENAGQKGKEFYETADRVSAVQQELDGKIRATSKGLQDLSAGMQKTSAARSNATSQLKAMGISSQTTTEQFQRMNLSTLEYAKVAKLTRDQMTSLKSANITNNAAMAEASQRYDRMAKRVAHAEFQIRKQVGAMGDAQRAMERWSMSGMKNMMLSQSAWIASGAVIFGVLSTIREGIDTFMEFNQGLTDAGAIAQATSVGMDRMRESARKAFTSSTMGAKDTTQALQVLIQAGMDAEEAAVALETVYKVTTATGGETTEVVKFLTTALNVWGVSANQAAKVGNILGAALNYSKLEVEDLSTTFNYAATMAQTVGMSIEGLAATIAVMANAGVRASTIGTGLTGVFTKLIAPTKKFKDQLATVGLTMDDVSLVTNDFFTVLGRLESAGFDMEKIFKGMRRREARAMNVLISQGADELMRMKEAFIGTNSVSVMFDKSMEGVKNQLILTGHVIMDTLVAALGFMEPAITTAAKSTRLLVETLKDLSPVFLAAGAGFLLLRTRAIVAATSINVLTGATTGLFAAFRAGGLISSHPIIAGLTALTIAVMAAKAAYDGLTTSYEEKIKQSEREVDDLRKLQFLLNDGNKSRQDQLRILADYAEDYPELLQFMEEEQINLQGIYDWMKKTVGMREQNTRAMKKERLEAAERELDELKKRNLGDVLPQLAAVSPGAALGQSLAKSSAKNRIKELREEIVKLKADLGSLQTKPAKKGSGAGGATEIDKSAMQEAVRSAKGVTDFWQIQANDRYEVQSRTIDAIIQKEKEAKQFEIDHVGDYKDMWRSQAEERYEVQSRAIDAEIEKETQLEDFKQNLAKMDKRFASEKMKISKEIAKLDFSTYQDSVAAEEDRHQKDVARINRLIADAKSQLKEIGSLSFSTSETEATEQAIRQRISDLQQLLVFADRLHAKKKAQIVNPADARGGAIRGVEKAHEEFKNEFAAWEKLAHGTATSMKDSFSDVFFDAMQNDLKSASDYWRSFANQVKRYVAEILAQQAAAKVVGTVKGSKAFGWLTDLLPFSHDGGLQKAHTGGLQLALSGIPRMHSGGGAMGLRSDEMLRVLQNNEFVTRASSVNAQTLPILDAINKTGRAPAKTTVVNNRKSYHIYANDAESFQNMLRTKGAKTISDISVNSVGVARRKRDPRVR